MFYVVGMTTIDQRARRTTRSALILLAVLVAGFLFRFLPLLIWPSIAHPDEVFQALEQGHRLAYGYGLVPWEFDYGARSWLLAYLAAGAMDMSKIFGGGPQIYLPLIAGLLSALGAVSTLCTFLWGRRFFGTAGGIAAALVSASWVDNMFFGGRSLTEVVAAHFFVIAIYLAEPGYRVQSRRRLFIAGLFAGAAFVFRIHLAPVIALLWIWRGFDWRRIVLLSVGAAIVVALDGAFDAFTWHYPFEPTWLNIRFNMLQHGSEHFGTSPWGMYFYLMGANWAAPSRSSFRWCFWAGGACPSYWCQPLPSCSCIPSSGTRNTVSSIPRCCCSAFLRGSARWMPPAFSPMAGAIAWRILRILQSRPRSRSGGRFSYM